ncbi:DNA polymerase Y family protein [Croceicoccus sp. F390]|uniref:DNA polymerase Y family protein n=1 Tax=Croceicoccus esteveae TaxID=3075597 RepID=A0ABU2ZMF8_9SPHN|nr:DNA polymerase Y family protein [Croceicoccus sp. F390]MDT0576764.1 DNA polymerase Y family protein [Croceicoccus sp. F390]
MTERRIGSIFLPQFPIQRWWKRSGIDPAAVAEPLVLAREGRHGPVVHDASRTAYALGVRQGARVTDMRALFPALRVEPANEQADAADIAELTHWCRRWCPWVQADTHTDGAHGLLLDVTGSGHLFGGEPVMAGDIVTAFAALGLTARVALAPTIGSAWALARHGHTGQSVCPAADVAAALSPLGVAALRLDADTTTLLARLGLKTVAALMAVPRAALIRRFRQASAPSANPVLRLDQALGTVPEPLVAAERRLRARSMRKLAEPIADVEPVAHVLADLLDDLCGQLAERDLGARRLRLAGYRLDGGVSAVEVATSRASRDAGHLKRLFEGRLETLDPGSGFEVMTLEATGRQDLPAAQQNLAGNVDEELALSCLIDRLVARLGNGAVRKALLQGSHIPERAEVFVPASVSISGPVSSMILPDAIPAACTSSLSREEAMPLRLLFPAEDVEVLHAVPEGPPARFRWRRQNHIVVRSQGPGRIAPEWWREKSSARLRDYYRVEDKEGRRFWLYREGLPDDGRGGAPRWFIHGLDA